MDALSKLFMTIVKGYNYNPRINYEVFIHKVSVDMCYVATYLLGLGRWSK
jgi:hypothetical protein